MERELQRQMTGDELFEAFILSRWHKTRFLYYPEVAYKVGLYIPTLIFGMANLVGQASRSIGGEAVKAFT